MIKIFSTDRNTLFFPTRWANSVARWILGLKSDEGTIRIRNTSDPGDGGGCSIDVDVDAIYAQIRERILRELNESPEDAESVTEQTIKDVPADGEGQSASDVATKAYVDNASATTLAAAKTYTDEHGGGSYTEPSVIICYPITNQDGSKSLNFYYGQSTPLMAAIMGGTAEQYRMATIPLAQAAAETYCALPDVEDGSVVGIKFGTASQLADGSYTTYLDLASIGGGGDYCVKPTFTNGVLTGLTFGSAEDIETESGTTVGTTTGCPYT